jgi:hypothetical protein
LEYGKIFFFFFKKKEISEGLLKTEYAVNGRGQVSSVALSDMVILNISKPETYVESSSRNKEMQFIIESPPKKKVG